MDTLIPVNIVIGDRSYRIKVAAKDEEHVRKTIKIINEKVLEFKTQFAGKDMQDYIAMVLVWFATQISGDTRHSAIDDNILAVEKLLKVEEEVTRALHSDQKG